MIFDAIDNAPQYFALHPHFQAAFDWLAHNPNAAEGRYEIAGDECFVMIQNPLGKGRSTPVLEAHDQYLDIQICLEGEDAIGWKARANCSNVTQEHSSQNDAMLWSEAPDFTIPLAPGNFMILYPHDSHTAFQRRPNEIHRSKLRSIDGFLAA